VKRYASKVIKSNSKFFFTYEWIILILSVIISPFEKYAELKFSSISKRKNTLDTYVNSVSLPDPVEKLLKETFNGIVKKFANSNKNNRIFHAILVLEFGIKTLKLRSNLIITF